MKQIIAGKIYNTATAEKIVDWDNGHYPNDFQFLSETLYITIKGQFFLHCRGGAATHCAQRIGNGWTGGAHLKKLSRSEAIDWCESRHIYVDLVTSFFELDEA